MKKQLALLAFLVLSSCATVEGLGSGETEDSPMFSAVRQIGSGIFSRGLIRNEFQSDPLPNAT